MNINEYEQVKSLNYLEYCDYLQNKYGIGLSDYIHPKSGWRNKKCSRTKEGLCVHHKYEDHAILLSDRYFAMKNPFEWQKAKNLVYCDYLEHLYLHILICENPAEDRNPNEAVGIGGIVNFIVPSLNDFYSGYQSGQPWEQICFDKVKADKDLYLVLLKRAKKSCRKCYGYTDKRLLSSMNEQYGVWSRKNNKKLFKEIKAL